MKKLFLLLHLIVAILFISAQSSKEDLLREIVQFGRVDCGDSIQDAERVFGVKATTYTTGDSHLEYPLDHSFKGEYISIDATKKIINRVWLSHITSNNTVAQFLQVSDEDDKDFAERVISILGKPDEYNKKNHTVNYEFYGHSISFYPNNIFISGFEYRNCIPVSVTSASNTEQYSIIKGDAYCVSYKGAQWERVGLEVKVEGTQIKALTDNKGNYQMTVPRGDIKLICSSCDNKDYTLNLKVYGGEEIEVEFLMSYREKDPTGYLNGRRAIRNAGSDSGHQVLDNISTKSLPVISISSNLITFADPNKNNALDAYEKATLKFQVRNSGNGTGQNLKVKIFAKGNITGVTFNANTVIPNLKPGETYSAEIPVSADGNVISGNTTFTVSVDEPNGLGSDPIDIEIPIKAFVAPLVKVADYSLTGNAGTSLVRKLPFDLQVLIQNTQQGKAEDVEATIQFPENIMLISGDKKTVIGSLNAGATKDLVYSLIVTNYYTANTIPIAIQLKEKLGKYAESKTISLELNQTLASNKITLTAAADNSSQVVIKEASLSSDVDKDIPVNSGSNAHRYALVIGNEDYTKYQTTLSNESNVAFAATDASIFATYCEKTLGVQHENVTLLQNAIGSKMKQEIDKISKLIQYENGNAEVIFYYAGHGFPDEATKESYIMPVDISGSNVADGIKLSDLYQKLTASPVKRVSVFLDACFSGGGRDAGLLAARSVKIKPKANAVSGNLLVLSASTGEQSSLPYKEKQHGMFTYFLLKKLQETKGDVLYKDLFEYVKQQVELNSIKVNGKDQNPELRFSSAIDGIWNGWKVK